MSNSITQSLNLLKMAPSNNKRLPQRNNFQSMHQNNIPNLVDPSMVQRNYGMPPQAPKQNKRMMQINQNFQQKAVQQNRSQIRAPNNYEEFRNIGLGQNAGSQKSIPSMNKPSLNIETNLEGFNLNQGIGYLINF